MRHTYLIVLLMIGIASSLSAAPITILNFSFEDDLQPFVQGFTLVTPTGWTDAGTGTRGTNRPSAFHFNTPSQGLMSVGANNIPDGIQTYYSNGGDIEQVLTTPVGPAGTVYALSLFVGDRWDRNFASYTVEFLAGTSVLASLTDTVTPAQGQFEPLALGYTATGTESGFLTIRLINNGGSQIAFDNVTLDATTTSTIIPEPSTFGFLALGLVGTFLAGRALRLRRRQE